MVADSFEITSQGVLILRPQVVAVYTNLRNIDEQIEKNLQAIASLAEQNEGLVKLKAILKEKGVPA